jgi:hypothetical protein
MWAQRYFDVSVEDAVGVQKIQPAADLLHQLPDFILRKRGVPLAAVGDGFAEVAVGEFENKTILGGNYHSDSMKSS